MDNPDPLENRPSAIKALYRNYEQRIEEAKKHARWFVNFNFILLGLAAISIIYAPLIAMEEDVKGYQSKSGSSNFSFVLFQMDFLRVGLFTVLILMSQHVIKLARYNFRLMTFYRARQDVLLMTTTEALPWRTLTPADLDQATIALSPDHVDSEIPSKTLIEMLRQLAPWRIKQTPGQ